jgi:hypothetical protein
VAFLWVEAVQNLRCHSLKIGEHGVSVFLQRPDVLKAPFKGRDLLFGSGAGVV